MNPEIELRQLRYFAVLAEELHFGRAAAALRVAQPALSQNIRRLEGRLGFSLFERTTRRVHLTAAGAEFLISVHRLSAELGRGVQSAREVSAGALGTVTVGYIATAMLTVLPVLVRKFRERHPRLRLSLRELSSEAQLQALRSGELDVAIVSGRPDDEGLVSYELYRDPLVALLPSDHRLAKRDRVTLSSLANEPFILFPQWQTPGLHDQIVRLCRSSGFEPVVGQEAQSWHVIAALVGVGLGVSVAPASVRRYRVAGVRFRSLRPAASISTMLCMRAGDASLATGHFYSAARPLIRP